MRFEIPNEITVVAEAIEAAGFEVYLVGGCVRDLLRGTPPKDWDFTTNATPEDLQKIFGEEESFYENDFGTVGVKTGSEDPRLTIVEVTPYRIESAYTDARRPDEVRWAHTLEEDLARRDFTMNAIAMRPHTQEIVDPYGGCVAITEKRIETVGDAHERFSEDALRMLRAIRLAAELDFTITTETAAAITTHAPLLEKISHERIRDELIRTIMSPTPMQALFMAQRLGLLHYILPELEEGIGIEQRGTHAYEVFEHTLRTLQHAADSNFSLPVRLAALLHDIGKPRSRREKSGGYTFYGHEVVGARMTKDILRRLSFPNDIVDATHKLVRWHMFFSDPDIVSLSAVRRMIRNVGGEERIWDLLDLRKCDRIGTGRPKEQPFRLRKYTSMVEEALRDPISVGMLKIDGGEIMKLTSEKPGPRIGWILHALLDEVLDDPKKNEIEYLKEKTQSLATATDDELKKLGDAGLAHKDESDEAVVAQLRKKHHVA